MLGFLMTPHFTISDYEVGAAKDIVLFVNGNIVQLKKNETYKAKLLDTIAIYASMEEAVCRGEQLIFLQF